MTDQLKELEIKYCYLEDTTETLNQVVIRQQEQIDRLERRLVAVEERLRAVLQAPRELDEGPEPE